MNIEFYDPSFFEKKSQNLWDLNNVFKANPDLNKKKSYILEMLPYPSGNLHAGHIRNYTIGDILARFKKHQEFNILHPIGFDSFGLPAENAAIQSGKDPNEWTNQNIEQMIELLKKMGFSYDYERLRKTHEPEYYVYEQEFFIKLYKKGLIYKKKSVVNWDPVDMTVLANEQVIDGKGWRSGAIIEKKELSQWFLKISEYSEKLLNGIENDLDGWPEKVKIMQKNWIGKSEGLTLFFDLFDENYKKIINQKLEIFTTRPETIFGASFACINPRHEILNLIKKTKEIEDLIEKFQKNQQNKISLEKEEKVGFFTGLYAENPFDKNQKLPIYVANFVLEEYGSGAIFSNPTHDKRDNEFAKKYNIQIKDKIFNIEKEEDYFTEDLNNLKMINSSFLDGMNLYDARKKIILEAEKNSYGLKKINYRLRDWGLSRQRYWGCPIPIIYCPDCGIVCEKNLPVKLPKISNFKNLKGNPLETNNEFLNVECPECKNKNAKRETDTLDTFFESSWYFISYANKFGLMNDLETNYWMPVDYYIGGIEHAILHLLYARFFNMLMNEENYVNFSEPFKRLFTQGMVCHKTYKNKETNEWISPDEYSLIKNKDSILIGPLEKMSKSKKNIIEPKEIIKNFGVDAMRFFIVSDTPPDKDFEWNSDGISGCSRFLKKLHTFFVNISKKFDLKNIASEFSFSELKQSNSPFSKILSEFQILCLNLEKDIENFFLNSAIAKIRSFSNVLFDIDININFDIESLKILKIILLNFLIVFEPFAPHLSQILFEMINLNKEQILYLEKWPKINENLILKEKILISININAKKKSEIEIDLDISEDEILKKALLKLENENKISLNQSIKKTIYIKNKMINIII